MSKSTALTWASVTVQVGDQPVQEIGDGLLVFERGVILLPPAAGTLRKIGGVGATVICTWYDSDGAPLPIKPVHGSAQVSVLPGPDLVGVNLNHNMRADLVLATPAEISSTAGYAAFLHKLVNDGQPPTKAAGSDPSVQGTDPAQDDEPPFGGNQPWWCAAFPSCWGC